MDTGFSMLAETILYQEAEDRSLDRSVEIHIYGDVSEVGAFYGK